MNKTSATSVPAWSLIRRDDGSVVVEDLRIADGFGSKLAGLQFRAGLPVGRALVLDKTSSVHTFWMRFPLDLVFIGADGGVLGIRRGVKPWRVVFGPASTHAILESQAGWIEVETGQQLTAVCINGRELKRRRSMHFLEPVAADEPDVESPVSKESEHENA